MPGLTAGGVRAGAPTPVSGRRPGRDAAVLRAGLRLAHEALAARLAARRTRAGVPPSGRTADNGPRTRRRRRDHGAVEGDR